MTTLWKRSDYDAVEAAEAARRTADAADAARHDAFLCVDAASADAARRTADARWVDAVTGAPTTSPEEDAQAERGDATMSGAAHRARIAARIRGAAASRRAHIDATQTAARSYLSAREEEELDALEATLTRAKQQTPQTDPWADSHGGPARTPTPTPTTPTTPLERLVAMYGVDAAFRIWAAQGRRPSPYSAAYRDAVRGRQDALHTERDAVEAAKVARLARRAAASAAADARVKVAVARAADVRARV